MIDSLGSAARQKVVNDVRRLLLSVASAFLGMYKNFPIFKDDVMDAAYLKEQMRIAKNHLAKIEAEALLLSSSTSPSGPIII